MAVAKIFKNGRSQAVRLPKEFRFKEGETEVNVVRDGDSVILSPKKRDWGAFWEKLEDVSDDFMAERDQGTQQERDLDFDK